MENSLSLVDYKSHFETNFFVIIGVTKEVIPIMRGRKKSGIIVNVITIRRVGTTLNSAYQCNKFVATLKKFAIM